MIVFLLLALLLLLSAMYSGSETGIYSLSRLRLDADAGERRPMARLLRALVRRDTGILITLLIGNNLMLEMATHLTQGEVGTWEALPPGGREVVVTLVLTPFVFVFGELLPKDLFRRRPHALLYKFAPLLALSRLVYLPLALPLQGLSWILERALGIRGQDLFRALGREEVLDVFREGAREGAIDPRAEGLARNVLVLRETPVSRVMLPWGEVETVHIDQPSAMWRGVIHASDCSRLLALRSGIDGGIQVEGYLHQLDVLGYPDAPPETLLRHLPVLEATLPVDKALRTMRIAGHRIALVGTLEAPEGLVSVMDLLSAISGEEG